MAWLDLRGLSLIIIAFSVAALLQSCGPAPGAAVVPIDPLTSAYTASESTEAILRFSTSVEVIKRTQRLSEKIVQTQIDAQLDHLFGPLSAAKIFAVPRGDRQIKINSVTLKPGTNDLWVIHYSFEGIFAVRQSPSRTLSLLLPVNPTLIYDAGIVRNARQEESYPCTDKEYTSIDDFWYFWNPYQKGCPLVENRDFFVVKAALERLPNLKQSTPDYDRLADAQGNVLIYFLVGMDEEQHSKNPRRSADLNAQNLRKIRSKLLSLGYTSDVWTPEKIRKLLNQPRARLLPYVEDLYKPSRTGTLTVRIFYGPSGIDENSRPFHLVLRDALLNASVVIYDGHSGLGSSLDLRGIEEVENFKLHLNKNRYQIYFFNSCSSYTYFNQNFFQRKASSKDPRGTWNLDILSNGLATEFTYGVEANLALILAIDQWAVDGVRTSYQELAQKMDSHNLFGVNGDEDNPKH